MVATHEAVLHMSLISPGVPPGSVREDFTCFAPNWVLFLFSLFEMIGRCNLYQIKANNLGFRFCTFCAQLGAFSIFFILYDKKV